MVVTHAQITIDMPYRPKEDEQRSGETASKGQYSGSVIREQSDYKCASNGGQKFATYIDNLSCSDAVDELTALTPVGREHDLRQVHVVGHMVEPDEVELVGREGEDDDGEEEPERAGQPLPRGEGEEEGQEARPAPDAKELAEGQREHFARGHLGLIG